MRRRSRQKVVITLAAAMVAVFATMALAAPAAIFTARPTGQRAFVDPVVAPGMRSSHEHCFYGAVGVDMTETSASLRAKPTTWVEQSNHSGFWIPCIYEDGRLLPVKSTKPLLFYYQPVAGTEMVPPENTKGVTQEVGYRCGFGGGTVTNLPPVTCDSGDLSVVGFFRAPRDLGLTQPFPQIRFFARFDIGPGRVGNITVGGPVAGVNGAMGPDTIHADYFWAWDRAAFENFLARCVRPGAACGTDPSV